MAQYDRCPSSKLSSVSRSAGRRWSLFGGLSLVALGQAACSHAALPVAAPAPMMAPAPIAEPPAPPAESAPAAPSRVDLSVVPTGCADGNAPSTCAPPAPFVAALCEGAPKPETALALFAHSGPWTHGYVNRRGVEAWYTGGHRLDKLPLAYDEEVVVLRHPKPSGILVNGPEGPYDVLRSDGTCASLTGEEVTLKRPPAPRYAPLSWERLNAKFKRALLSNDKIAKADEARRRECTGGEAGAKAARACSRADEVLNNAVLKVITKSGLPAVASADTAE